MKTNRTMKNKEALKLTPPFTVINANGDEKKIISVGSTKTMDGINVFFYDDERCNWMASGCELKENDTTHQESIVSIVLRRILYFVPFIFMAITSVFILLFRYMYNYVLYGGESIAYTHKNQRKQIADVYDVVSESLNKK